MSSPYQITSDQLDEFRKVSGSLRALHSVSIHYPDQLCLGEEFIDLLGIVTDRLWHLYIDVDVRDE